MAQDQYATPADLRLVYPAVTAADPQLTRLLAIAQARLLARVPSIPRRVAAQQLDVAIVKATVIDMVVRVLLNDTPSIESTQGGAGSFSYSAKAIPGADRVRVLPSDLYDLLPPDRPGTMRVGVSLWP